MKALLACFAALTLSACAGPRVLTGIDVLARARFTELEGKKIGLITNHTGKTRDGRGTVSVLAAAPDVTLLALFSPEHGFTGVSEEFRVTSTTLLLGGRQVPVHSLYSGGIAGMRPKPSDLIGLDALLFDIQDIGARFYTYLATMAMAMEEAAKLRIPFYVLDRPNPINGWSVEGPVLEDLGLRSVTPTAYFQVPIRHGMTAGELALMHNETVRHPSLRIIKMEGWKRSLWYDDTGLPWTPPSPNMPELEAASLYPGLGLFEASNLAVGRGTPIPFRWVGAPWMEADRVAALMNAALLDGVEFSVQNYTPSKSIHAGQPCRGLRINVLDRGRLKPTAVFLALNSILRELHPRDFQWRWDEAKKMTGTEEFRRIYEGDGDPARFKALFEGGAEGFLKSRRPFLLYQ
jgi:uncharacterized protein YbbC (DUF1343 family)